MGKPEHQVYEKFIQRFYKINEKYGMKQYAVPYLMSSHPGCTMKEAVKLAEYVRDMGFMPEQVQDFYPTPSTMSTCMYYTGIDPRTGQKVYVPKDPREKAMQRALLQYRKPENYELVREALEKAGRTDLIGFDGKCLLRPRKGEKTGKKGGKIPGKREQGLSGREKTGKPGKKKPSGMYTEKKQKSKVVIGYEENGGCHRGFFRYGKGVCPADCRKVSLAGRNLGYCQKGRRTGKVKRRGTGGFYSATVSGYFQGKGPGKAERAVGGRKPEILFLVNAAAHGSTEKICLYLSF